MPDFSPKCQAARDAYQAAMNAYYAARDAHIRAQGEHRRAVDELDQAQQRLADATAALTRANAAWDQHIAAVRANPALGVPNVEAGVQPPQAPPAGAAVAGLFRARVPPNFSIWASGDAAALSAWQVAADAALQRAVTLRRTAQQAEAEVAQRTADHAAAAAVERAARQAEQAARAARSQASGAAAAALAQVKTACAGQVASHPLAGGGEIEVGAGVLPDDEHAVRDKLDSLPDEETEGLDKVELRDKLGPASDISIIGHVDGQYVVATQTIQLFIAGHSEETLKHEVGHHVYHDRLSEAARDRWKRFYNEGTNGQQVPAGKMPTGYATTDEGEGFPEVYEYYRNGKPLDPEVRQLMEDLLEELS